MRETDYYEFPNCMHALAAAMHRHNVDPGHLTILLPQEEWCRLWCALESKFRGMMMFDGSIALPGEFMYMGFKFKIDKK